MQGGSSETEAAVTAALAWLARVQSDDGRWDAKRGEVVATEQVSLYGLIIDRRTRPLRPRRTSDRKIWSGTASGNCRCGSLCVKWPDVWQSISAG